MSRAAGRRSGGAPSGDPNCVCDDKTLTVKLPPPVLPTCRYALLTVVAVKAVYAGAKVEQHGDYVVVRGNSQGVIEALGLRAGRQGQPPTPTEFCDELCAGVRLQVRPSQRGQRAAELRIGATAQPPRFQTRMASELCRGLHLYMYARDLRLFQRRAEEVSGEEEGGGRPVPLDGHLHVYVGRYQNFLLGAFSFGRWGEEGYALALAELSPYASVTADVVRHLFQVEGGGTASQSRSPRARDGEDREALRDLAAGRVVPRSRPPWAEGAPLGRLLDVWYRLEILERLPSGDIPKVPTLAVVRSVGGYSAISYIGGGDMEAVRDALDTAAGELRLKDYSSAVRMLKGLLLKVASGVRRDRQGAPGDLLHKAVSFAEGCLAGRVDWDLYYQVERALHEPGREA